MISSANAQNLIAGSSAYSAITESDARLGGAVSLSYYGGDVEKVKLTYEIGESYISNAGSKYAKNCVDLQGIKRYNIFRYLDDINMLLPVATEFDEENNTLFTETDELGYGGDSPEYFYREMNDILDGDLFWKEEKEIKRGKYK